MQNDTLEFKAELKRKLIHISCSVIPIAYYVLLSREQIVVLCGLISLGFIIAEILRFKNDKFKNWFKHVFSNLIRENEKSSLTGATYLFISLTIIFLIFDKKISIPAALILTIADSFAAIVGKAYGRAKYFNKTVTGSLAFYMTGLVIFVFFLPELGWSILLTVLLLTIIEAVPIPMSDNITLPLSACLIVLVVFWLKGVL